MRIGLDLQASLIPQATGLGYYVNGLYQALQQIANPNEVVGLTGKKHRDLSTIDRFLHDRFEINQLAVRAGVDIVHQPGFSCPKSSKAVIWTLQDLRPIVASEKMSLSASLYWKHYLPYSARYADVIVSISESTARDAERLLPLKGKKLAVIPVGVPEEVFSWQPNQTIDAATKEKFRITRPYLVAVGTIQPIKNYSLLPGLLARYNQQTKTDHQLIIVGKRGWGYGDLEKAIAEAGLKEGEDIIVTDYVTDQEKYSLISSADALLQPSLYEGFGLPILEAQALGVPVICSNTSSMPEVAGSAGLLADPTNLESWLAALSDLPKERDRLIATGKANVTRFRWNAIAKQWLALYRSL